MAAVYAQSPSDQPRRSGAPKVFGILSIIFASIMTLGSFFVFLATLAADSIGNMTLRGGGRDLAFANELKDQITGFYSKLMFQPLILLVCSVSLLAIGIGQVTYKRWAQRWSVIWGWSALAAIVLLSVLAFAILGPAYNDLFESMSRVGSAGTFSISGGMGTFIGVGSTLTMVLFLAPYPILLIAFFNGKKVREAMVN